MSKNKIKDLAYGLLNLVTLKKGIGRTINNRKVRFPARWSRYYPDDYESDNYSFLEQQVTGGMHVIDIGAHIGLFSVCASQLAGPTGKIVCFEPTPGTFSVLRNTLRLNHCNNVTAVQAAVGREPGKAVFYISNSEEGCNSNSLVLHKGKKEADGYDVVITTIDAICQEYNMMPGLIKIDVEGAELDVLKGGINIWKTVRPLIILGLHPAFITTKGDSLREIWELIKRHGYNVIYNGAGMNETDFITQKNLFDVRLIPAQ